MSSTYTSRNPTMRSICTQGQAGGGVAAAVVEESHNRLISSTAFGDHQRRFWWSPNELLAITTRVGDTKTDFW
jgi:hypothetical protein